MELLRELFQSDIKTSLSIKEDMLVGSVSGFVGTVASCPFETIKCNMQIDKTKSLRNIKISNLYNGFGASCAEYFLLFTFLSILY